MTIFCRRLSTARPLHSRHRCRSRARHASRIQLLHRLRSKFSPVRYGTTASQALARVFIRWWRRRRCGRPVSHCPCRRVINQPHVSARTAASWSHCGRCGRQQHFSAQFMLLYVSTCVHSKERVFAHAVRRRHTHISDALLAQSDANSV